jgi:hypothetical protein
MYCYKHPKVETGLSCGKCERPICTDCMIVGPAGVRCKECAAMRGTHLYQIAPLRLVLCVVTALVVGFVGTVILSAVGFFCLFIGPLYGGVMAQAIIWASGRKRGTILDVIAIGGIVVGALSLLAIPAGLLGIGLVNLVLRVAGVALAVSACYARMRYW